jgi:hypothetical protein
MNPHVAIRPPTDRRQDFEEVLKDFDAHCHDRIKLDPNAWHLAAPVRLLSPEEQEELRTSLFGGRTRESRPEFKGAPALYGFSEVYFNQKYTLALVYATQLCGSLCGEGFWVVFELQNGKWKELHWSSTSWQS